jgi:hypothetical protein
MCNTFSPNVGILFLNGVVNRHRFDADPYPDSGLTFPFDGDPDPDPDSYPHVSHKLEYK